MEYISPGPGVDVKAPLIYLWEIHDLSGQIVGRYVGKANGGEKRPTRHYPRNVNKLLAGRPYKNGKNYRRVHFALADAVRAGHRISLTYLCNVSNVADILQVESRYIDHYGCNKDDGIGLNGRWKGTPREVVPVSPALLQEAEVEDSAPDLDDFLEYFDDKRQGISRIIVNGKSCSIWSDGRRILRAKQLKPGATVFIKLVQSSSPGSLVQFAWDGGDGQIEEALERERKALLAKGITPRF